MNFYHPISLRRPAVLAILLTIIVLAVMLPAVVQARWGASGENGCGNFIDSVATAVDGDVLLPMPDPRNSESAIITKTLVIQGGWSPPSSGCATANQTFPDEAALRAAGFTFGAPTTRGGLFSVVGPVLNLGSGLRTLEMQHLKLDYRGSTARGGGINGVIDNGAHVRLENVVFTNDEFDPSSSVSDAGGGLYLEVRGGSRLVIANSQFISNAADQTGGGFEIHIYDNSEVIIQNTQISDNKASGGNGGGGHILIASGSVTIVDSVFSGNQAPAGRGGALSIERIGNQGQATATLLGVTFSNNSALIAGNLHLGAGITEYILDRNVFVPLASGNPAPADGGVAITGISLDGSSYSVAFQTLNFQMSPPPSQHVHFFFNTVPVEQAGMPGSGPWYVYYNGSPFTGYGIVDRPPGATQMCVVVANPDHTSRPNTASCVDLP